jgi:hypothetical protein
VQQDPPAIDEYITANRPTYTDEAIRETLISVGHDPQAINEAFARLGLEAPQAPAVARGRIGALVGLAVGLYVFFGVLGLAGIAMAASFGYGRAMPFYLVVYFGLGLALVLLVRFAVSKLGIGGIWAGLLGLALFPIFIGLMLGTCATAASAPSR